MVVNLRKDKYDVYIGRPSKWGNPYSHLPRSIAKYRVATRDEAIEKYKEWFYANPDLVSSIGELKGKVLGCFCKPNNCHGDFLSELANK